MLKINKDAEPKFFVDFKKEHQPKAWEELKPITTKLRKHMIKYEQTTENTALCVYCERKIAWNNSHIDHIHPKDPSGDYSHQFADYDNLSVSCCSKNSCGQKKGNLYHNDFINPIEENPSDYITYEAMTGEIVAVNRSVESRVKTTCKLLGLNSCYELLSARRRILLSLNSQQKNGVIIFYINAFKEFPTLIDFYRQKYMPQKI